MEERSRRRIRELVTQLAAQRLSENEIGRARTPMRARSVQLHRGLDTFAFDQSLPAQNVSCNARSLHTFGHMATKYSPTSYLHLHLSKPT